MRVLHFLDSVNRGGAEMQALDVMRNAADFGMDLTVVTAGGGGLEEDFINTVGADLIRIKRKLPVDPFVVSKLRKVIKEREIQIVQSYQAVEGLHLHLACLGLTKVKKVLSFQGFIPDSKNRRTMKFLIPRTDANILVSKGLQDALKLDDGLDTTRNSVVIYNGADPQRLRPTGKSLKQELGLSPESRLMGMVANFYKDPRKDQRTVVRSLRSVLASVPRAHFVFAGKTEAGAESYLAECKQICDADGIADRVHFLGARTDVPDILSELDVFVLSSLHEGLPVSLTEAMLAKVAAVVSDIPQFREVTNDGEVVKVFEVGNSEHLSETLIGLLTNDEIRRNLAESAHRHATGNFSISAHMRDLRSLYERLLES